MWCLYHSHLPQNTDAPGKGGMENSHTINEGLLLVEQMVARHCTMRLHVQKGPQVVYGERQKKKAKQKKKIVKILLLRIPLVVIQNVVIATLIIIVILNVIVYQMEQARLVVEIVAQAHAQYLVKK